MEHSYHEFWSELDPDTQEVIRKMDNHEGLGYEVHPEMADRMIEALHTSYEEVKKLAGDITQSPEKYNEHIETIFLILSYSPNPHSFWYVMELVTKNPKIYQFIYEKALNQRPLKMYGKLLRERMTFYITRKQIMKIMYSVRARQSLIVALEGIQRET